MSNEIRIHEGELLRKILLSRFATLKEAASELALNYNHLSEKLGEPNLTERYKTRVCRMLGISADYFETGIIPPQSGAKDAYTLALEKRAEEADRRAEEIWKKYLALLEKFAGTDKL